ncbi:hypothetical protein N7465_004066 [Penicillium sp. CMV-2018d]|nr:hypothetical protein N7465_004066 [Penicillium sp. CMV-2018d]
MEIEVPGFFPEYILGGCWSRDYLKNDFGYLDRLIATDSIIAEHALREQTQREEALRHRATALQKATAVDSDSYKTELEEANEQLEEAKRHYPKKEQALYRAESMLPPIFRDVYDSIRHDAAWFMIARIEADVVAGVVVAVHKDIFLKRRKE